MIPGELLLNDDDIEINAGRKTKRLKVSNTGDRPIQVGSHTHFFEVNRFLKFDRESTLGFRLNIPAGTATRFEPGQAMEIDLVEIAGANKVYGMNGLVMGSVQDDRDSIIRRAKEQGFIS